VSCHEEKGFTSILSLPHYYTTGGQIQTLRKWHFYKNWDTTLAGPFTQHAYHNTANNVNLYIPSLTVGQLNFTHTLIPFIENKSKMQVAQNDFFTSKQIIIHHSFLKEILWVMSGIKFLLN